MTEPRLTPDPVRSAPSPEMSVLPLTVGNVNEGQSTGVTSGAHGDDQAVDSAISGIPLADLDYAVVDVETTGWYPDDSGITEIGAVRLRRGDVVAEFTSLVNPGTPVPEAIVELTGISDEMLAVAPPVAAVMPGLLEFAKGCVLIAHNARFDLGFLRVASDTADLAWPDFPVIDTVRLARQLVLTPDEVPDCKLGTLAGFFGTPVQPTHRALADARATASVLVALLKRLADHGICTLGELVPWLEEREAAQAAAAEAAAAETTAAEAAETAAAGAAGTEATEAVAVDTDAAGASKAEIEAQAHARTQAPPAAAPEASAPTALPAMPGR